MIKGALTVLLVVCLAQLAINVSLRFLFRAVDIWRRRTKDGEKVKATKYSRAFADVVRQVVALFVAKIVKIASAAAFFLVSGERKDLAAFIERPNRIDRAAAESVTVKKLILIRHGESVWNYSFNRGVDLAVIIRTVLFWFWEAALLCEPDSVLLDSPLSAHGIAQCLRVQQWIAKGSVDKQTEAEVLTVLRGESRDSSVIVTSNLRRAISTALLAMSDRLRDNSGERVCVLSCLQEATRNPDGMSLAKRGSAQEVSQIEKSMPHLALTGLYGSRLDCSLNNGNKSIRSTLSARLQEFATWVFDSAGSDVVVVSGHSDWFRNFFRAYLPPGVEHSFKTTKIPNAGVVKLEFQRLAAGGEVDYAIVPGSINSLDIRTRR